MATMVYARHGYRFAAPRRSGVGLALVMVLALLTDAAGWPAATDPGRSTVALGQPIGIRGLVVDTARGRAYAATVGDPQPGIPGLPRSRINKRS